jgi:hypothetical protein
MAGPIDKTTRIFDLSPEDRAKTVAEVFGHDGYLVSTTQILAETLGRLRRANDGLRQVETGEWQKHFGGRGEIKQLEPWVGLMRREVAQAAIDVEQLLKRAQDKS